MLSAVGLIPLILFAFSSKSNCFKNVKLYSFILFSFIHLLYEIKDTIEAYIIKKEGYRGSWQNSLTDQISAILAAAFFIYYIKLPLSPVTVIVFLFIFLLIWQLVKFYKLG